MPDRQSEQQTPRRPSAADVLRGYDSVQLAAARTVQVASTENLRFARFDNRPPKAAKVLGAGVVPSGRLRPAIHPARLSYPELSLDCAGGPNAVRHATEAFFRQQYHCTEPSPGSPAAAEKVSGIFTDA